MKKKTKRQRQRKTKWMSLGNLIRSLLIAVFVFGGMVGGVTAVSTFMRTETADAVDAVDQDTEYEYRFVNKYTKKYLNEIREKGKNSVFSFVNGEYEEGVSSLKELALYYGCQGKAIDEQLWNELSVANNCVVVPDKLRKILINAQLTGDYHLLKYNEMVRRIAKECKGPSDSVSIGNVAFYLEDNFTFIKEANLQDIVECKESTFERVNFLFEDIMQEMEIKLY